MLEVGGGERDGVGAWQEYANPCSMRVPLRVLLNETQPACGHVLGLPCTRPSASLPKITVSSFLT